MQVPLCLLLAVSCAWAAQDESRAKKHPIVVDAVGNTLPPPSNVPATVGSPVNLLTPDRYEFYTFDESGELVKRLMTLQEIQAIVAAGEESEGLVTIAEDKLPTSSSNYSQPPYTVLHSVVTNVKNVLKEQMEAHKTAHKKNPMFQPTLDTPDVSDSWSLILPSIFGNTGLDIVPDKTSNGVTTSETEMFEVDQQLPEEDDNLSKEGTNEISSSSTTQDSDIITVKTPPVEEIKTAPTTTSTTTTTTTTTLRPTTTSTTTTPKPTTKASTTTTTKAPITATTKAPTTTTTKAPITTTTKAPTTTTTKASTTPKLTTAAKISTTTKVPITIRTSTTSRTSTTIKPSTTKLPTKATTIKEIRSTTKRVPAQTTVTTSKPRITISSTSRPLASLSTTSTKSRLTTTTVKPTTTKVVRITPKVTTSRPSTTKKQPSSSTTSNASESSSNIIILNNRTEDVITDKIPVQYEKVSTFVPTSTVAYVTEKLTQATSQTTKPPTTFASTTKRSVTTTTRAAPALASTVLPTVTTYRPSTTTNIYISSTTQNQDLEKSNATTITTQSVSPSTTMTSTEFITIDHSQFLNTEVKPTDELINNEYKEPIIPLFDLAQSISQISSDLGSPYMPLPTVSNMLDSSKLNDMNLESKESFEIDIPVESDVKKPNVSGSSEDNFVKISTLDPHSDKENKIPTEQESTTKNDAVTYLHADLSEITTTIPESTTMDKILSESMGDLLSQVVNETPQVVDSNEQKEKPTTTEANQDPTTTERLSSSIATTTQVSQTEKAVTEVHHLENDILKLENRISEISNGTISDEEKPLKTDETLELLEKPAKTNNDSNFAEITISNATNELNTEKNIISNDIPISNETSTEKESGVNKKPLLESNIDDGSNTKKAPTLETVTMNLEKVQDENIDTSVKINKVPELLPKVDDYKKKIQKVNIDDKEFINDRNNSWKLISTVSPPKTNDIPKDKHKLGQTSSDNGHKDIILEFSTENQGLEATTKDLEEDIAKFTELCNELAFRYWNAIVENIDKRRSFVLSPYSITSMLAMMFMGARGATSGEMNDILKLDDMVTFNPHFTLKNISDSIETSPESGVMVSAFIRELYSDRNKGKILTFYKERAQHFYNGHVEEINFKLISDIIRRRTNLLVKRYTWGKIAEYMKSNTITMEPPLAAFSTNIFQTDCTGSSVEGRDGEMYFVVSPNVRQRRLVPVPAVVYRSGFLAGYDPVLDATAAALGNSDSIISTLFVMPGQQGNVVHGEDLETLEQRLLDADPSTPAWNRLLRTLLPRIGLELQIPRFSHKSIFNISSTLKKMGLKDLFDAENADLGGLNGPSKDLYLSDMIQSTTFVTCGEGVIGEQHHVEEYPESLSSLARRRASRWASDWDEPRDYQRAFHDPHDVGEAMHLPLHLRPRQARLPARNAQPARLKFDRPFLYFVRHNPSGMILYVGRYNPRLLP